MTQQWLEAMLRASWQGPVLALFVVLLLRVWRTAPPACRAALWLIVALKFVAALAFVVELPLLPAAAAQGAWSSAGPETTITYGFGPAQAPALGPLEWGFLLWSVGASLCVGRAVYAHLRLARVVRSAAPAPAEIAAHLSRLGCNAARAKTTSEVEVPFVFGLFAPVVVLPVRMVARLSSDELRMVLAHECAHVVRRDALASLLLFVCQALFWFHPAAWLVRREWQSEREAACDAWAVQSTGADPHAYAAALLRASAGVERVPALAISAVSSFRSLERRIKDMKTIQNKNSGRLAVTLAVVLMSVAALPFVLVQRTPHFGPGIFAQQQPDVKVTQKKVEQPARAAYAPTVAAQAGTAMSGTTATPAYAPGVATVVGPAGSATPAYAPGVATAVGPAGTATTAYAPGQAVAAPVATGARNLQAPTAVVAQGATTTAGPSRAVVAGSTAPTGQAQSGTTAVPGRATALDAPVATTTVGSGPGSPAKATDVTTAGGRTVPASADGPTTVTIVVKDRDGAQGAGLERRVTLDVENLAIGSFFASLSRVSGVKITVVGVSSRMRINAQIEHATLGDVMGTVARVYSLEWRLGEDGSITVQPFHPGSGR